MGLQNLANPAPSAKNVKAEGKKTQRKNKKVKIDALQARGMTVAFAFRVANDPVFPRQTVEEIKRPSSQGTQNSLLHKCSVCVNV